MRQLASFLSGTRQSGRGRSRLIHRYWRRGVMGSDQ